jgi:hypothetical protein
MLYEFPWVKYDLELCRSFDVWVFHTHCNYFICFRERSIKEKWSNLEQFSWLEIINFDKISVLISRFLEEMNNQTRQKWLTVIKLTNEISVSDMKESSQCYNQCLCWWMHIKIALDRYYEFNNTQFLFKKMVDLFASILYCNLATIDQILIKSGPWSVIYQWIYQMNGSKNVN